MSISIDTILNPGYAIEQERKQLDAQIAHLDILLAHLNPLHAPAIGACADDTLQLDQLFPVRECESGGRDGWAVYSWNAFSSAWQPVGVWRATEAEALKDRSELLSLLDMEIAA